jgi:hypothetical protein
MVARSLASATRVAGEQQQRGQWQQGWQVNDSDDEGGGDGDGNNVGNGNGDEAGGQRKGKGQGRQGQI